MGPRSANPSPIAPAPVACASEGSASAAASRNCYAGYRVEHEVLQVVVGAAAAVDVVELDGLTPSSLAFLRAESAGAAAATGDPVSNPTADAHVVCVAAVADAALPAAAAFVG